VTREDILDAAAAREGPVIQHRVVALRSQFRALRQEKLIFRDPTRGISLPATVTELLSHASRAASGPVIRRSSGKLEAMIAREAARPAATMM
jgi:hypothetical protein